MTEEAKYVASKNKVGLLQFFSEIENDMTFSLMRNTTLTGEIETETDKII